MTTRHTASPPVIRFKSRVVRQPRIGKSGSFMLIRVPDAPGKLLTGMTNVEGTINGHPFRATLEPGASGGRAVPVNQAMLAGADAAVGDTVALAILGPEPKLAIPADLRAAFTASHAAKALWGDLTPLGQRDWVRWIESAKTPQTRARRVKRTTEQLAEGKRRPCCVNLYEFMLSHIDKD
jgi:hypothetical protein